MMITRALLTVLALLAIALPARAAETQNVTLVVFSDIYEMAGLDGRGGFARVAAAIAAERARSNCSIVAHAGDTLSPSLMSGLDQGAHIVELTNRIAPDVFVPGNHEFDFGEAVFRQRMSELKSRLLAANLRQADGQPVPGFTDQTIFTCGDVRIGVFGLTDDGSARRSNPETLKLSAAIPTAREQVTALRAAGADIVVAVSHTGWQDDLRLAGLGGIDVVLTGHDHNLWVGYDGKTVIAEAQSDGLNLVAVDLAVATDTANGRKVSWRPSFRVLDTSTFAPEAGIAEMVSAYQGKLVKELSVPVGVTAVALDSRKATVRNMEAALGNFIADAFRAATGADLAIVNGGSIRGDTQYEAGRTLTRMDLRRELPFSDKVVVVEMSGADVREALENGVWFAGKGDGRFCHISGARIVGRLDAVPGNKLTQISIGNAPLDPEKTYKVAVTTYLASGKDGYTAIGRGKRVTTDDEGRLAVEIVLDAVAKAGTIAPTVEGRVTLE